MSTVATKERPILFSTSMVAALLAGTKTQTRRAVKHPLTGTPPYEVRDHGYVWDAMLNQQWTKGGYAMKCPYGVAGERLWVKETIDVDDDGMRYRADGAEVEAVPGCVWEGRAGTLSSIHCPRWASRLTLEVTGIRVERVRDIGRDGRRARDVLAEGVTPEQIEHQAKFFHPDDAPALAYGTLWDSINGKGSWAANPWVWVVEFKRIEVLP